jgi:hypothetical protein
MTEIHFNSGTVMFNHALHSKTVFGYRHMREASVHPMAPWRSIVLKKRAFIVKFVSAQDLYDLIWKKKLPNERTAEVKGNRLFRIMAASELHVWKELRALKVTPEMVEDVYQMNA